MNRWPTEPIIDALLERATSTRPPRRSATHGLPVALVDLAAVVGVSHGSVSNLIARGEIGTRTARAWAVRLGVDPTVLWPGFVDDEFRRCESDGCDRRANGATSTRCKRCQEARRRRGLHVEAVVQRFGDRWVVDVSTAGSNGAGHVVTEKRATAEACERWAVSAFGDRLVSLTRFGPQATTPDDGRTSEPMGSNLRGVLASIEAENMAARPFEGPPDEGRPCEAWACPRGDADAVSGLCGFHAGRETNRASAHRFGRGTGPQVTP